MTINKLQKSECVPAESSISDTSLIFLYVYVFLKTVLFPFKTSGNFCWSIM